jgi:tetratricopeptide (TPR) repeat protein
MRVGSVAVGVASVFVLCAGAQGQTGVEADLLRRGSALEERGEFAQAKAVYLGALRQSPRRAELHFRIGTIFLRESNWTEAIRSLARARDLRPRHVDTLYYLAQAYYLDGQQRLARETIRRASDLAPTRGDIAQKYGEYLCEGARCQDGLHLLLKAQRLDPDLPDIEFDLGMAYHRQSAVPEARQHLETALRKDPANLVAARFLADTLHRMGESADARDLYERVLTREPQNAWALYGLGRALVSLGKYEEALAPLRQALALDPTIAEAHFQLARALRQVGQSDEERRELRLFRALGDRKRTPLGVLKVEQTPFESRLWEECQRLVDARKESAALAYLDSQTKADKANSYYLLGVLYFNLGRSGDAARMLEQAAAMGPENANVLAFLGRANVAQGQLAQAEETLAQSRTLAPNGELPLVGLGELEYARGHWSEAINLFEQSKTIQVPVLLTLCRAYLHAGNRAKALEVGGLVRAYGRDDAASLRALDATLGSDQEAAEPGAAALPPSP